MGTAVLHRVVPGGVLSTSSRSACTVALLQKAVQTDTAHLGSAHGAPEGTQLKADGNHHSTETPSEAGPHLPACLGLLIRKVSFQEKENRCQSHLGVFSRVNKSMRFLQSCKPVEPVLISASPGSCELGEEISEKQPGCNRKALP